MSNESDSYPHKETPPTPVVGSEVLEENSGGAKGSQVTKSAMGGKKGFEKGKSGYRAENWSRKRKVIARVEATARETDVRFVVTNVGGRDKPLYENVYSARGRMENMIKEHKLYTRSDRTSCHRWEANRFRLFLHTGAYWLLHQLRQTVPRRSPWRTATFETLRRAFLKIAVRIEELKSRIKIALPSAYPYHKALIAMTSRLVAQGP